MTPPPRGEPVGADSRYSPHPVWAHSANIEGHRHRLEDHLRATSAMAADFAEAFGAREAGAAVGLLHDAGKLTSEWQEYLREAERARRSGRPKPVSVDHKTAGSLLADRCARFPGRHAVLGHHGRIPDKGDYGAPFADLDGLSTRLIELIPEAASILGGPVALPAAWRAWKQDPAVIEFGTRMLHSALVDADSLDTAAHFKAADAPRPVDADFVALHDRFESRRRELLRDRPTSWADAARQDVYDAALTAAAGAPGFYRMPAPTGSGKTLAAAGFALRHAALHARRRVIVAVPYLTITEQTSRVYRALIGDDVVLEHHSAVEPRHLQRYGVENWDAPFIVTTTVQLFDSLYSGRPSASRKLHRIVNSVIVLDEVQAIPPHALSAALDALRILVEHFGCTVLLASATQPPFELLDPFRKHGVRIASVIPDPKALYRSMRRVAVEWAEVGSTQDIAALVAEDPQSLVIVNTTSQSRELARVLLDRVDHPVHHLSTRMCPAHRRTVLEKVRVLLDRGEPVTLVSTQLIEAGVDIDFPVVYRGLAPADSLLQAAGRSNREGRVDHGRLVVLHGAGVTSIRAYETGIAKTLAHFRDGEHALDDPEHLEGYYRDLFTAASPDHDGISRQITRERQELAFARIGESFRMIPDDSESVVVVYADDPRASEVVGKLRKTVAEGRALARADLREAQPFVVSLPRAETRRRDLAPYLTEIAPGLRAWSGPYDALVGVDTGEGPRDVVW